jgi:hypothetical protein
VRTWKACWVYALAGSNPASSALVSKGNRRLDLTGPGGGFAAIVSVLVLADICRGPEEPADSARHLEPDGIGYVQAESLLSRFGPPMALLRRACYVKSPRVTESQLTTPTGDWEPPYKLTQVLAASGFREVEIVTGLWRQPWGDGHTVWESILSSPLVRGIPQTERHPIEKDFLAAWTDARTQSPDFDPQPVIVCLAVVSPAQLGHQTRPRGLIDSNAIQFGCTTRTWSIASAAARRAVGITWEWRSVVMASCECPRISISTCACTFCACMRDAQVCHRSWRRMR